MTELADGLDARMELPRDEIIDRLADALAEEGPQNILLAGPWGSGKTTLARHLERRLANDPPAADALKPWHVLWFSPWEETAYQDPGAGFLRFLALEVANAPQQEGLGADLRARTQPLWDALVELAIDSADDIKDALVQLPGGKLAWQLARLTTKLVQKRGEFDNKPPQGSPMRQLRYEMRGLLQRLAAVHKARRLLLVVDDLDRARPEDAVAVLDALYHLFMPHPEVTADAAWPLSSLWPVNIAMLEEFLYEHYRRQPSFKASAYLEKLFHRRINVPPLYQVKDGEDARDEPLDLWLSTLRALRGKLTDQAEVAGDAEAYAGCFGDVAAERLARGLSFAVLGNLRLYRTVRESCCAYWELRIKSATRPAPDILTTNRLLRDAQLLTLVQVYPGFREAIALYDGMWPHFVNRLNARLRHPAFEPVENPAYRHIDDPNLLTLLLDLDVLTYDEASDRYVSRRDGQERLARELGALLRAGF